MLDNKTKERIAQEAEKLYPYVWPKNKHGEEIVMRVGQKAPPFSAKIRKIKQAYIAGAEAEATRAAGLVDLLAKIRDHLPVKDKFNKEITDALTNYNNSK